MVNRVQLLGRLGKDPVLKHFSENNVIAEFSLATTESYRDKEGKWVEVTDWHNVKLPFKSLAERAEKYLKKGSLIYLEGKIKTRSYDDKDGNKRYVTEIVAESLRMLDKKDGSTGSSSHSDNGGGQSYSSQPQQEYAGGGDSRPSNNIDDDLPF
ncbi:MAG: single-stranded DNA-binding protein [Bacteroidetes bacterium]|nr:single-stranded DNA-binding protein [Bacteroidota bacterium]